MLKNNIQLIQIKNNTNPKNPPVTAAAFSMFTLSTGTMFVFSSDKNRGDELLCDTGLNNLLYLRALALLVLRLYAVQESTTHETIIHRREKAFIFSCSRLQ